MRTCSRTVLLEAAAAGAIVAAIARIAWPAELGLAHVDLHPAWIACAVLSARYGPRGLFVSLAVVAAPVAGIAVLQAGGPDILHERFAQRADLVPLIALIALAWVGMSQHGKLARVSDRLAETERQHKSARGWSDSLEATVGYLRWRCDRIDASVQLWRCIARRIERGDVRQASDAALELSMLRTGAEAGIVVVQLGESNRSIAARRGLWTPTAGDEDVLRADATARAAVAAGSAVPARDVRNATDTDSDIAVPVMDELDGSVLGVLALRGTDPARLGRAELRDLALISEWLSPAIARHAKGPRLHAVGEENTG